MPKVIKSAGRDIILKVKRACEEERDNNGPTVPFSKAPSMGNRKAELQEWLTNNNIEVDDCWTKAQLYELIKRHKGDPKYEVDKMLNENGHEVLRLPPYHCDLNPIEKIWAIVKRRIAEKNVNQAPSEIASITEEAFSTITTEEWVNSREEVIIAQNGQGNQATSNLLHEITHDKLNIIVMLIFAIIIIATIIMRQNENTEMPELGSIEAVLKKELLAYRTKKE
ncbi:unnamed protein product [Colias eurytheme]|nr:unnamed protein product [Colias eurytheme]